jgi:hypothetical protein
MGRIGHNLIRQSGLPARSAEPCGVLRGNQANLSTSCQSSTGLWDTISTPLSHPYNVTGVVDEDINVTLNILRLLPKRNSLRDITLTDYLTSRPHPLAAAECILQAQ